MKRLTAVTLGSFTFLVTALPLQAQKRQQDVQCQKVFVTGSQTHEIAWALKGDGLKNNLYKRTCMQPVADASKADAILVIEIDPLAVGVTDTRIMQREAALVSGALWVSCRSDRKGSYCIDSKGYALETSCNERGCSSYYGPDVTMALWQSLGDLASALVERSAARAYLFSATDHRLIWKHEVINNQVGQWHQDLTNHSQCPKASHIGLFPVGMMNDAFCKAPRKLLDAQ